MVHRQNLPSLNSVQTFMDLITLGENISVGSSEYKLKLDVAGTLVKIQNILPKNYKNKTTRQPLKTKKSYSRAGQL